MTDRRQHALRRGAKELQLGRRADPTHIVVMGEAAEWRAAYELGAWASAPYADISPMKKLGRDSGWDFVLRGRKIDVKWSAEKRRCLLVSADIALHADVYVLVVGAEPNDLEVAGWAWRKEVVKSPVERLSVTGRPSYCFPTRNLRDMRSLRRLAE